MVFCIALQKYLLTSVKFVHFRGQNFKNFTAKTLGAKGPYCRGGEAGESLGTRHLDVLTEYSSCKLKTRQDERQGIKLPLEAIAFNSDSFVERKINVEQKVAENWAPYGMPRCLAYFVKLTKKRRRYENVWNSVLTEILTYFNHHIYRLFV